MGRIIKGDKPIPTEQLIKARLETITRNAIATTQETTVQYAKESEHKFTDEEYKDHFRETSGRVLECSEPWYKNPQEAGFDSPKGWGEQPKTIEGGEISNLFYTPDWEERRYELAKAAMQGILANQEYQVSQDGCYPPYIQNLVKDSISFADEMINQLKTT